MLVRQILRPRLLVGARTLGVRNASTISQARDTEDDAVLVVTLNDPDRLNALTETMGEQLLSDVVSPLRDDTSVRAVVLTGAGRAFSAGGDLGFLDERTRDDPFRNAEKMRRFYQRFLSIREIPVPVIAAVNGHAIGAGACLAMACDLRIIAEEAKFGFTFVGLGLHPGMGATHFVPRAVGPQIASKLLLTGETVNGAEAVSLGLAAESTQSGKQAYERALQLARKIANGSQTAVRTTVRSLRLAQESELERALWREADAQAECYAHPDMREGIAAITSRRAPNFRES